VRTRDGNFTTFDSPPGSGGLNPGIYGPLPGINPSGAIAGTYFDASGNEHGFLRDKGGAFTTIDVPGAFFTEVFAINPSGAIVGDFCNSTTCYTASRYSNGSFTRINTPGALACGGGSTPTGGINPAGAVTGTTLDPTCSFGQAFLRTPDGTVTTFSGPGATRFSEPMAINPAGAITGFYAPASDGNAFLRAPDGAITCSTRRAPP
jgi:uncharacterized membrane protein